MDGFKIIGVHMLLRIGMIIFSIAAFGNIARAYDFSEANASFERRGSGTAEIERAVSLYEASLSAGLSDDEQVFANDRIARLHAYHAQLVGTGPNPGRAPHFQKCIDAIGRLADLAKSQSVPHFYFWMGACKMLHAESKGVEYALKSANDVIAIVKQGQAIDASFEGGGFDRILGALLSKLPPFNPWGQAGDVRRGMQHLEASLASSAFSGAENPENETGDYFFETNYYYANALNIAGQKDAAIAHCQRTLERIASGDVNPARIPETKVVETLLKELLTKLQTP